MELFKQGAVRAQYPADNAVLQKLPGAVVQVRQWRSEVHYRGVEFEVWGMRTPKRVYVQGFTEETLEAHRRVFANPELGIGDATGLGPGKSLINMGIAAKQ